MLFELRCWRRLLRVPWTSRRSNQSILKEISPEYSLEGLMLLLKLQYSGHLMWRADSFEKTQILGKIEGRRRKGRQRRRWLYGITESMDLSLSKGVGDGQGGLTCCSPWGCKESYLTERLNWTELNWEMLKLYFLSYTLILEMRKQILFLCHKSSYFRKKKWRQFQSQKKPQPDNVTMWWLQIGS